MTEPATPPTEEAVDLDLVRLVHVLSRRRWVVAACLLISVVSAALYAFTARPVYTAEALLLIEKETGQAYDDATKVDQVADDYYQTQYRLLRSRTLLRKVYAALGLEKTEEFASGIDSLAPRIAIAPVLRSRLVHVRADSFSPELAMKIANRLSETYVTDNIENKLFISKEILRTLRTDEGSKLSRESFHALPAVVNNQLIQNLKANHANLEARWSELSARYTPEHPVRARLKAELDAVRSRVEQETDRVVQGMKTELSGTLLGNNIRIVDPAELPERPSKPRKKRLLLLAALGGLLLGALAAFAVEALDQSIRSQEDVEQKLGLPFLGAVTKAELQEAATVSDYRALLTPADSLTGESLRNVRTMLGFAAVGGELKALLVTSTGQGEGKTFMATNLALVFAQLGERVLVIEGDLRRPSLHKRFRCSKERGLGHFLAHGQDVSELEGLVQPTDLPNLHVLPCGPIPPNPAELLSTPRVKGLVSWARGRYDRILVDGTPVFPISDALLWGGHLDAAVFVVKFGSVHAGLALRAHRKIQESGLKVAGAIINQVTWSAGGYYGDYYYAYRQGYGSSKSSARQGAAA
ncbi:MAG: polysaccharide biosynthesis tyrosine autokinase [Elusimicrobia bacterium]|nr:polysaccharide biosynthesis tyrosine autokinase [Elusimicrobiota bacterium]